MKIGLISVLLHDAATSAFTNCGKVGTLSRKELQRKSYCTVMLQVAFTG